MSRGRGSAALHPNKNISFSFYFQRQGQPTSEVGSGTGLGGRQKNTGNGLKTRSGNIAACKLDKIHSIRAFLIKLSIRCLLICKHDTGTGSVSIELNLDPDPTKNLYPNSDPEDLESGSGSKLFL